MNKKTRNISLLALAAGVAIVPIIRYFIKRSRQLANAAEDRMATPERTKGLFSAYRGGHLPHHRKPTPNNGHTLH